MVTRRARGFTLSELMVTVAVLAILASVAAPSFNELIANQRAKGAASDLFSSLLRTRSEAIKRNMEVSLAPATAGTAWAGGWSIAHPANAAVKLENHGAVPGATITGPAGVVFLPNGRVKGAAAPSFDVSSDGAAQHRCVSVDLSGRPYQTKLAC
ncbi:GspH/FimT family pseudopilin [Massilia cavernae]|uniref:Type II secretion system protein H n=1 Tax=Massilia cavernae TaxID=2320864 RepID=A0A418XQC9_9BURK|nr:GspH/FimT family pseudopilin [Massilia cavernae]RJG14674.1 prepilin-type N-terminal cleavage/methylation domain-containing protein [Massilia cavernae]